MHYNWASNAYWFLNESLLLSQAYKTTSKLNAIDSKGF